MEIRKAVRHRVNLIMSISGPSGSGKTYSALLLAAGLVSPGGKVGFVDTENGRGVMYADSPGITAALPQGYDILELAAPFTPARYKEALDAFERKGYEVVIIDSGSHEWEGEGGCSDMAEADRGRWNRAKKEHKRFVMRLLNSNMHVIVCLRAREKSKIIDKKDSPDGKEHVIPMGMQPVAEKNFVFEMMCSWMVEEKTHLAIPMKLPEQFQRMFATPKLLTKDDGERIRKWNEGAADIDPLEKLQRQARAAAEEGVEAYKSFFSGLQKQQQRQLAETTHESNKQIAIATDAQAKADAEAAQNNGLGADGYALQPFSSPTIA